MRAEANIMNTENITVLNLTEPELEKIVRNAVRQALEESNNHKTNHNPESVWLSRVEASKHLKVSLPTLDSLTKKGVLTAYRTGRKKRFNLKELNESISQLKIKYTR